MFSGIIRGTYPVTGLTRTPGLLTVVIDLAPELMQDLEIGASISVDGVCLTVTTIAGTQVSFDIMQQTLNVTTLGELEKGDLVNIERSHIPGTEIGGHLVSGHVDGMATITAIDTPPNNFILTIELPLAFMKYIFPKGFIALNGVSLTIADVDKENNTCAFYLIPETLRRTTFGQKTIGDNINFEIDRQTQAMVDTVERYLDQKK